MVNYTEEDGPFEEIVIVDVRMTGNQYHARASLYRRFSLHNEMQFMRKTPEYGPFDVAKHAIRVAALGVSQRRIKRVFVEQTHDIRN